MKNTSIIILLLLVFQFTFGQSKKIKSEITYYDKAKNLKAQEYSYYKKKGNEVMHGNYTSYYENGQVESNGTYNNGKLNGKHWLQRVMIIPFGFGMCLMEDASMY